jgi:hypothetical protein
MGKVNSRRELRVFLSSTFRDMQFERNYLVKHIFPELKPPMATPNCSTYGHPNCSRQDGQIMGFGVGICDGFLG